MVKKGLMLLCLLVLLLPGMSFAATQVIDESGLFSADEIAQMEELISSIQDTYQMDAVVLTTDKVPNNRSSQAEEETMDYADEYFDRHGYGWGEDRAGLLYLIDMNNRVSYVSTNGVMIDYIDDDRLEELLNAADSYLYQGQYGKAAIALLQKLRSILSRGIEEGHFRYDTVTGERLSGIYNKLTGSETVLAAVAGLGAAALLYASVAAKYGLKKETYRFNKQTQSDVLLTRDEKTFLRQHVTRTRISSGSGGGGSRGGGHSGGSGVHISSGGGSHGGGGHHF